MSVDLVSLLRSPRIDREAIAGYFDALSHAERVRTTRGLPRELLPTLFAAAEGFRPLTSEALVPPAAPLSFVARHIGTNNLPMWRSFEKPMYRDARGRIAGRNVQRFEWLTGPGYFTVSPAGPGEVLFDYAALPEGVPPGWPPLRSNARGLSYFVFRELRDVVRAVSRSLLVGRAYRGTKPLPQYFLLVRET